MEPSGSNAAPEEFVAWLRQLRFERYTDAACAWWVENGAATLEEVFENWEIFATDLELKSLERKRLEKDVASRAIERAGSDVIGKLKEDLGLWLEELHLGRYLESSISWCERSGASTVEEVWANWEEVVAALGLKPLEHKRVERDVAERLARRPAPGAPPAPPPEAPAPIVEAKGRSSAFGPPEDPQKYTLLEEIGFGVTSKVYRCIAGQKVYAAKAIGLKKLRRLPDFPRISERFYREISILLQMKHNRIVKLIDVVEEHDCLYLVMELVKGGELAEWIVRKGAFSELMARNLFVQIVDGLTYIHSKGVIHRDLKPDNILVTEADCAERLDLKLTDFGHSRPIDDGLEPTLTARVGTAMYWAPEVCDPQRAALGYDQTADLWSLGVVLYVMLIGFFPFMHGESVSEEEVEALRFERRSSGAGISVEAQNLIKSLLKVDPKERLTLQGCLRHPWVVMLAGSEDSVLDFMKLSTDPSPHAVEVRVPLTIKPDSEALYRLRQDLQQWMHKFKFFATIRAGDVIANLGDAEEDEGPGQRSARGELQAIVERHCGRGMIVVSDQRMWNAIAESRSLSSCSTSDASSGDGALRHAASSRYSVYKIAQRSEDPASSSTYSLSSPPGLQASQASTAPAEEAAASSAAATSAGASSGPAPVAPQPGRRSRSERGLPPSELQVSLSNGLTTVPEETPIPQALPAEDEETVLAALRGVWRNCHGTSNELYKVDGWKVVRRKGPQDRDFTLRWNRARRRLEWGSGKYILQPPEVVPLQCATWMPNATASRDFGKTAGSSYVWRRLPDDAWKIPEATSSGVGWRRSWSSGSPGDRWGAPPLWRPPPPAGAQADDGGGKYGGGGPRQRPSRY